MTLDLLDRAGDVSVYVDNYERPLYYLLDKQMKAYYIFQQADEATISDILDWMRNRERAIYRAAVRELGALKKLRPVYSAKASSGAVPFLEKNAFLEAQRGNWRPPSSGVAASQA